MVVMNTALYFQRGHWWNQNLAALFAVVSIISIIVNLLHPGCGSLTMTLTDSNVTIPKGTRVQTSEAMTFVTLRRGKIGWLTLLWCRIRGVPIPREIVVPVRCEFHD